MLQLIQEMPQILSEAAERLSFLFILHATYYINIQFDEIQAKKEGPSEKYQRAFFIIEHSKGNQGCLLVVSELQGPEYAHSNGPIGLYAGNDQNTRADTQPHSL